MGLEVLDGTGDEGIISGRDKAQSIKVMISEHRGDMFPSLV